jgi:hypothetical protein
MDIKEKHIFGEVEAYKFGFGPLGPPLMSVFLYYLDGLVIDTAQSHMEKNVIGALKEKKQKKFCLRTIMKITAEMLRP